MLEVAVVYSVRAFGEGFPKVSEMSVVFGDVHKGGICFFFGLSAMSSLRPTLRAFRKTRLISSSLHPHSVNLDFN